MNGTRHHEVGEYLRRLQRSMGDLPDERRDEILVEIEEHIAELLARHPEASDADVRNVLERVGDPQEIAAEARERFEVAPVSRSRQPAASWTDLATVTLLVLGTLLITPFYRPEAMVVAWVAAIVLLWMSEVWRTRDKALVTLVLVAGALGAIAIQTRGTRDSSTSRSSPSPQSGRPPLSASSSAGHASRAIPRAGPRRLTTFPRSATERRDG